MLLYQIITYGIHEKIQKSQAKTINFRCQLKNFKSFVIVSTAVTNQGAKFIFVLSCKDNTHQTCYNQYFLPTVKINDCNVIIDGKTFFDQTVKNDIKTYNDIRKNASGQGDDYTTVCLKDYLYSKNYYKMIAIDYVTKKRLILIQKKYNKLVLLEISMGMQQCF